MNSDEYVIMDDVQFTRRDWRNRNIIKNGESKQWLTIPVENKGNFGTARVMDMKIADYNWTDKHLSKLEGAYKSSDFWAEFLEFLQAIYKKARQLEHLTEINYLFLVELCNLLKIDHNISMSTKYYSLSELDSFTASERLVRLAEACNAQIYLTGPAALNYLDLSMFHAKGIEVKFADYSNFKDDRIDGSLFDNNFSILDLLARLGINKTREHLINHRLKFNPAGYK